MDGDTATTTEGRFATHYSVWGPTLDIDDLLSVATPGRAYELWRNGDVTITGDPAVTSGLIIQLFVGNSPTALHQAIEEFLRDEAAFLRAIRQRSNGLTGAGLTTFISMGSQEMIPVGLDAPVALLESLARSGVSWTVTASVFTQ